MDGDGGRARNKCESFVRPRCMYIMLYSGYKSGRNYYSSVVRRSRSSDAASPSQPPRGRDTPYRKTDLDGRWVGGLGIGRVSNRTRTRLNTSRGSSQLPASRISYILVCLRRGVGKSEYFFFEILSGFRGRVVARRRNGDNNIIYYDIRKVYNKTPSAVD